MGCGRRLLSNQNLLFFLLLNLNERYAGQSSMTSIAIYLSVSKRNMYCSVLHMDMNNLVQILGFQTNGAWIEDDFANVCHHYAVV